GGHIGYSVRPGERRKGYATLMLSKMIGVCREKNMEKILVTCLKSNQASRKTILKNGGVYEDERFEKEENDYIERYWITL
uniref:GNAT family N-acetyltransferase n=1 Tax=uncultured Traorella sp. TaxID=1929048 RepID=UPI0025D9A84D